MRYNEVKCSLIRTNNLEKPLILNDFRKEIAMVYLFHYLSILNLIDGVITFFGLEYSIIGEMNPIMDQLYQLHPFLFISVKLTLSFFLYLFIFFKQVPNSKSAKAVTYFASGLYTVIFFLHSFWVLEYINVYF